MYPPEVEPPENRSGVVREKLIHNPLPLSFCPIVTEKIIDQPVSAPRRSPFSLYFVLFIFPQEDEEREKADLLSEFLSHVSEAPDPRARWGKPVGRRSGWGGRVPQKKTHPSIAETRSKMFTEKEEATWKRPQTPAGIRRICGF